MKAIFVCSLGWVVILFGGISCGTEVIEEPANIDAFPYDDGGLTGKADSGSMSEQKRALLLSMKARYETVRYYKGAGTLGESMDGYLAVPEHADVDHAMAGQTADYRDTQAALIDAENLDRGAYYDLRVEDYRTQIEAQIEAQLPAIRKVVVAEICADLPPGTPCDAIADAIIAAALEEALKVSVDEALGEIKVEIELLHGDFWQTRTTKRGEWIQVKSAGGAVWRKK